MLTLTSPVETPLHRLPPGVKLGASLVVALVVFALDAPGPLLGLLAAVAMLYLWLGAAFFRAGLSALGPILPFIVVVGAWHGLTRDGANGTLVILRIVIAVAVANLVTMTTPLLAMMSFIERAAAPLRLVGVSPRAVALTIAVAVRFVPVFRLKMEAILLAWRARSCRRPRPSIVVPLLLCLFDDAERVADALRARGGIG